MDTRATDKEMLVSLSVMVFSRIQLILIVLPNLLS